MPFRKNFRSNCFIIFKPFINGRIINSIFALNRTIDSFFWKNFFIHCIFLLDLIHKMPRLDKNFSFYLKGAFQLLGFVYLANPELFIQLLSSEHCFYHRSYDSF